MLGIETLPPCMVVTEGTRRMDPTVFVCKRLYALY